MRSIPSPGASRANHSTPQRLETAATPLWNRGSHNKTPEATQTNETAAEKGHSWIFDQIKPVSYFGLVSDATKALTTTPANTKSQYGQALGIPDSPHRLPAMDGAGCMEHHSDGGVRTQANKRFNTTFNRDESSCNLPSFSAEERIRLLDAEIGTLARGMRMRTGESSSEANSLARNDSTGDIGVEDGSSAKSSCIVNQFFRDPSTTTSKSSCVVNQFFRDSVSSDGTESISTAFSSIRDERDCPVQHGNGMTGGAGGSLWLAGCEGSPLMVRLIRETEERLASGREPIAEVSEGGVPWEAVEWRSVKREKKSRFCKWRMLLFRMKKVTQQRFNGIPPRPLIQIKEPRR